MKTNGENRDLWVTEAVTTCSERDELSDMEKIKRKSGLFSRGGKKNALQGAINKFRA